MVEVAIGGRGQLESAEADVVERLVVDAVSLVRVLHQLVHGERRVVGLDDGVGHFWRRHDCKYNPELRKNPFAQRNSFSCCSVVRL